MIDNSSPGSGEPDSLTPEQISCFWDKVPKSRAVAACWEWDGARIGGTHDYGQLKVSGKTIYAHRISYALHHGPIPSGLRVLHSCDNPPCVNPSHLSVGTAADNSHDMRDKGRSGNKVLRGAANGNAKLDEDKVRAIRAMAGSVRQVDIAARFGVTQAAVSAIVCGKVWRHVAPDTAKLEAVSEA